MAKLKEPLFNKGDRIKLEIKRVCNIYSSSTTVLISPSCLLTHMGEVTFTEKKHNYHMFRVAINKETSEKTSIKNNDVITISSYCFDELAFEMVKQP